MRVRPLRTKSQVQSAPPWFLPLVLLGLLCLLPGCEAEVGGDPDSPVLDGAAQDGTGVEPFFVEGSKEGEATGGGGTAVSLDPGNCMGLPLSSYKITGYHHGSAVGAGKVHAGDDLSGNAGTAVYAVWDGTVLWAKNGGTGWGTLVMIKHTAPDGAAFVSVYGHLRQPGLAVSSGQVVTKGALLGYLGTKAQNGGWAEHLHFAIYTKAVPSSIVLPGHVKSLAGWEDPIPWINKHGKSASCGVFACKPGKQNPSGLQAIKAGSDLKVEMTFTNTGNTVWTRDSAKGVSNPQHLELWACDSKGKPRTSEFAHPGWISAQRVVSLSPSIQTKVNPGQTARFLFSVRAPKSTGKKQLYVIPTLGGKPVEKTCFGGAHFYFDVQPVAPPKCSGAASQACGNCSLGTQTRTCSGGKWSAWSSCKNDSGCKPGSAKTCTGGKQTCSSSCKWGTCVKSCACTAGKKQCVGSASQTCGSNCQWGAKTTCTYGCKSGACQTCNGFNLHTGCLRKIYRYYKGGSDQHHHYTDNSSWSKAGYSASGSYFRVHIKSFSGSAPIYALTHWAKTDTLVTCNGAEVTAAIKAGYQSVTLGWALGFKISNTHPLYRSYSSKTSAHFLTLNKTEHDNAVNLYGYKSEGVACYVWSAK